jgi:TetR/AcrR family transcriptional repressor of nem operon
MQIAHDSRTKLIDAALYVIRAKGFTAARVEDICEAAELTKGSFFHHFAGKEDLALAAAEHFSAYADLPEYTCLLGTMVQETYDTHPAIRKVCDRCIAAHAATLVRDIDAAIEKYGIAADWTAASLAYHTQAVIQGAFILAKAQQSSQVAAACLDHLRRYIQILFDPQPNSKRQEV